MNQPDYRLIAAALLEAGKRVLAEYDRWYFDDSDIDPPTIEVGTIDLLRDAVRAAEAAQSVCTPEPEAVDYPP
jgi:hypothetical protein